MLRRRDRVIGTRRAVRAGRVRVAGPGRVAGLGGSRAWAGQRGLGGSPAWAGCPDHIRRPAPIVAKEPEPHPQPGHSPLPHPSSGARCGEGASRWNVVSAPGARLSGGAGVRGRFRGQFRRPVPGRGGWGSPVAGSVAGCPDVAAGRVARGPDVVAGRVAGGGRVFRCRFGRPAPGRAWPRPPGARPAPAAPEPARAAPFRTPARQLRRGPARGRR